MIHRCPTPGPPIPQGPAERSAGTCARHLPPGAVGEAYVAMELATAPPERLQAVLYDAAIRICRQAAEALGAGQVERAAELLGRARTIILHLQAALYARAAPSPPPELAELYEQVHRRLIEADYYRKRETVEESIQLLHHRRPALSAFLDALGPPGRRRINSPSWVG